MEGATDQHATHPGPDGKASAVAIQHRLRLDFAQGPLAWPEAPASRFHLDGMGGQQILEPI